MKKFLAIVLSLVMVLSVSAVAFADGSPVTEVTVDSLEEESEAVSEATVESTSDSVTGKVVPIAAMTEEQKEDVNDAIATVTADGGTVTDAFAVEVEGEGEVTVWVEVAEDGTVYVVMPDGTVVKLDPSKLTKNDKGQVGVTVSKSSVVVIAK